MRSKNRREQPGEVKKMEKKSNGRRRAGRGKKRVEHREFRQRKLEKGK